MRKPYKIVLPSGEIFEVRSVDDLLRQADRFLPPRRSRIRPATESPRAEYRREFARYLREWES